MASVGDEPRATGLRSATDRAAEEAEIEAIAEAVIDILVERGLVVSEASRSVRIVDAVRVARVLGRGRRWVYAHAQELGGFRYGDGPRSRLGFDLAAVERWKRERQIGPVATRTAPRGPRSSKGLALSRATSLIPFEP